MLNNLIWAVAAGLLVLWLANRFGLAIPKKGCSCGCQDKETSEFYPYG